MEMTSDKRGDDTKVVKEIKKQYKRDVYGVQYAGCSTKSLKCNIRGDLRAEHRAAPEEE